MSEELRFNYEVNHDFVERGGINKEFILQLGLQVSSEYEKQRGTVPCHVVLVIDTSGSMNETAGHGSNLSKRQAVRKGAEKILDILSPDDRLSLVCFDTKAYIDLNVVSPDNRNVVISGLDKINSHYGGTNFEEAFKMAKRITSQNKDFAQRVIFLTDGHNVDGNYQNAHQINREMAGDGITVDCLGVGQDFKFSEMKSFTDVSKGFTDILKDPDRAEDNFLRLVEEAQHSVIRNTSLLLAFRNCCRDVEIGQLAPEIRYFGHQKADVDGRFIYPINIPTLVGYRKYEFLVRFKMDLPTKDDLTRHEFLEYRLSYELPGQKNIIVCPSADIGIHLENDNSKEIPATHLDKLFDEIYLVKLMEDVDRETSKARWAEVIRIIKQAAEIAKKNGLKEKYEHYSNQLAKLEKSGKLTQDDINLIYHRSSTVSKQLNIKADNTGKKL